MKLYIKNFQGISEAEINLKGFTVLTGRSNSGKSSIRRALELVLYNKWDAGFLKTGEKHCIVKLTIDENNYIQISKPENTYTVMINGTKSVYPKVGKNTLTELDELGLDYFYDSENYYYNVHIRSQIDPWFYITFSNQEQSRIIASIFNFDEIKSILKRSYKDKTDVTSQAENLAEDIDNLKIEGQELSTKLNLLKKVRDKVAIRDILKSYLVMSDDYRKAVNKEDYLKYKISFLRGVISNLVKERDLKNHILLLNSISGCENELSRIFNLVSDISAKQKILNNLKVNLRAKEDIVQFKRLVKST